MKVSNHNSGRHINYRSQLHMKCQACKRHHSWNTREVIKLRVNEFLCREGVTAISANENFVPVYCCMYNKVSMVSMVSKSDP